MKKIFFPNLWKAGQPASNSKPSAAFTIAQAVKIKEAAIPILRQHFSDREINTFNLIVADSGHANWSNLVRAAKRLCKASVSNYSKLDKKLAILSGSFYAAFASIFAHAAYFAHSVSRPVFAAIYGTAAGLCVFALGVCAYVGFSTGKKFTKALEEFSSALSKAQKQA